MFDRQIVRTDKTKWHKTRQCACGDCRFFSEQERPRCPAMVADPKLQGEWLWAMDPDMLGYKDYIDPIDNEAPSAFNESEEEVSESVQEEEK